MTDGANGRRHIRTRQEPTERQDRSSVYKYFVRERLGQGVISDVRLRTRPRARNKDDVSLFGRLSYAVDRLAGSCGCPAQSEEIGPPVSSDRSGICRNQADTCHATHRELTI